MWMALSKKSKPKGAPAATKEAKSHSLEIEGKAASMSMAKAIGREAAGSERA